MENRFIFVFDQIDYWSENSIN